MATKSKKKPKKLKREGVKANPKMAQDRIKQCLRWLRDGYTRAMVLRDAAVLWGLAERQIETYYGQAQKIITEQFQKDLPHMASDIVGKLDYIYEKTKQTGELAVGRQAMMDKAKLAGLLKDNVVISGIINTGLDNETDDDLDQAWTDDKH